MPYDSVVTRGSGPTYSSTPGAHPLIPEVVEDLLKGVEVQSVVMQMLKHMPMSTKQTRIPVVSSFPTAAWISGDTGLKGTTKMDWSNTFLNAEEIAVIVPIPEALIDDSDYDLWGLISPRVKEAFAIALDAAVLFGTNRPATFGTDIFTAAVAAGNSVTRGVGIDIAEDLNNCLSSVEVDGFRVNGIAIKTSLEGIFRNLRDSTRQPIFQPNHSIAETNFAGMIWNKRTFTVDSGVFEDHDTATANAAIAIVGDFKQALLGIRQDMKVKYSTEAVLFDDSGNPTLNAFQQDMVFARYTARYGFVCPNITNRMNQNAATRYPFAVLRDTA